MSAHRLTRRQFGKAVSALVVAFSLSPRRALAAAPGELPGSLAENPLLDSWVRINGDGTATVFTGKVELGQGALTALAQIAAEELDLPFARVHIFAADTARTPDEGFTSGSQSIDHGGTALRLACAEARGILLDRAARRLRVSAQRLQIADGVITAPDGRKIGYGELASAPMPHSPVDPAVRPKPPAQHKIVGQPIPRLDIPAKVTGGEIYVQDVRFPGMLHGRILRPPRYGASLVAVDEAAARRLSGVVRVVRDGSFLGVIAQREEQAIKARELLLKSAQWQGGTPLPSPASLYDDLLALPMESTVIANRGSAASEAAKTLEATYTRPYIAHASIGPSCAVAKFKGGKLRVWSHTQGVFPLRRDLAKALNMAVDDIRVTHVQGSGCYGHNGADDVALDAALLARAVPGRSVRVQWMRDDEFRWEPYGPAMVMRLRGGLDTQGRVVEWDYQVFSNTHSTRPGEPDGNNLLASWYLAQPQQPAQRLSAGGGDRNAIPLYDFPNQRVVGNLIQPMPLRISALRSLGAYANVFAIESFMDELAEMAGADPVEFRLQHLKDKRARVVIQAAAEKAGWTAGEKPVVAGEISRGRGIGFAKYKNLACYVAVVAMVEVERRSGRVRVPQAVAIADAGQVINPDGLVNQIEGGVIQSTSWTLHEAVRFTPDGIASCDWQSYPILTFPEVPRVEVALIDRPDAAPVGVGEAAQGPTVAAIANAVAHATGGRLRDLPLSPERVKTALH
ncbi:MAG TPA: molybdopterin cofactor-binding domain-containing protein [Alphaproteobacteria bacterium]|nr:molybdopterin cofactor-binding domain-containing protein [Alphaproteobacteria bacterium]